MVYMRNDISRTPFCQWFFQKFYIFWVLESYVSATLNRHSTAALLGKVEFAFTKALAIIGTSFRDSMFVAFDFLLKYFSS